MAAVDEACERRVAAVGVGQHGAGQDGEPQVRVPTHGREVPVGEDCHINTGEAQPTSDQDQPALGHEGRTVPGHDREQPGSGEDQPTSGQDLPTPGEDWPTSGQRTPAQMVEHQILHLIGVSSNPTVPAENYFAKSGCETTQKWLVSHR